MELLFRSGFRIDGPEFYQAIDMWCFLVNSYRRQETIMNRQEASRPGGHFKDLSFPRRAGDLKQNSFLRLAELTAVPENLDLGNYPGFHLSAHS